MVKFLCMGSYTADGAKALAKEGGSQRKAAVEKMLGGADGLKIFESIIEGAR